MQPSSTGRATVISPEAQALASPTLSLPSPRQPRAAPHSPEPASAALNSPILTLPSHRLLRAASNNLEGLPTTLVSPTLSLPRPEGSRAACTSPGLALPPLESVQGLPDNTACGNAAADGALSPEAMKETKGACSHLHAEEEERREVEVYALSEIWNVFEQIMKQVMNGLFGQQHCCIQITSI